MADRTALFTVRTHPRWWPPPCWKNFKWRYLRNRSSDPLHAWLQGGVFGVGAIFDSNKFKMAAAAILVNFECPYLRNGSRSIYIARIARSSLRWHSFLVLSWTMRDRITTIVILSRYTCNVPDIRFRSSLPDMRPFSLLSSASISTKMNFCTGYISQIYLQLTRWKTLNVNRYQQ